ncbi:MAG: hypothetical protein DRO88_10765 [Promethearchaeia archaeon]|nr:MAG: hypothetical protein DRO88_10765 [Candidatus Lokiarchaeia archaeon]
MFVLTHIFVPLLILELIILKNKEFERKISRFWLVLGGLLPDLIDKPLSLTFPDIFSGRGVAHAPLLWIVLIGVFFFYKPIRSITTSTAMGIFIHLLLDIPEIPWLWPFVPFKIYHSTFQEWFNTLIHNPVVISTEILSFIGLIVLLKIKKIIFDGKILNVIQSKHFLFNIKMNSTEV